MYLIFGLAVNALITYLNVLMQRHQDELNEGVEAVTKK
jgi:hypothetical protein